MDYQTILSQRSTYSTATAQLEKLVNVQYLPTTWWAFQDAKYIEAWNWYTGEALNEVIGHVDNQPVYRFPLKIGVRNIFRKHVSFLYGEAPDNVGPLVRTLVRSKRPFVGEISQEQKDHAAIVQQAVNEIWTQSNGRSIQQENGLLGQFLGGQVYQCRWMGNRRPDLRLPILINMVPVDWFYPVWSDENKYDLLEAFVVYKINGSVAAHVYGIKPSASMVFFVEHWTKDTYSIYVDGNPIRVEGIEQKNLKHPFKIVPFSYIPHLREAGFYGMGHLDDIIGLVLEFNARMSDQGLAIKKTVQRKKYVKNLGKDAKPRVIDGEKFIDLGVTLPGGAEPEVQYEDPPEFPAGFTDYTNDLRTELRNESHLQELAYGENEGTQRSALALASQMWPSTAHARQERTHQIDGLLHVYKIIMHMLAAKPEIQIKLFGKVIIRDDFATLYDPYLDWMPILPRDREAQLNEMVLRSQSDMVAVENAMEQFGDVQDIEEEKIRIIEWKKQMSEIMAEQKEKEVNARANEPIAVPGTAGDEN